MLKWLPCTRWRQTIVTQCKAGNIRIRDFLPILYASPTTARAHAHGHPSLKISSYAPYSPTLICQTACFIPYPTITYHTTSHAITTPPSNPHLTPLPISSHNISVRVWDHISLSRSYSGPRVSGRSQQTSGAGGWKGEGDNARGG